MRATDWILRWIRIQCCGYCAVLKGRPRGTLPAGRSAMARRRAAGLSKLNSMLDPTGRCARRRLEGDGARDHVVTRPWDRPSPVDVLAVQPVAAHRRRGGAGHEVADAVPEPKLRLPGAGCGAVLHVSLMRDSLERR